MINTNTPSAPLKLWYDRPASEWLAALPIGNGRLGAMVYGDPVSETVQLNEGTVWAGGPHDYASPEGLAVLPEIRRLVFADQWREAHALVDEHFMGRPLKQAQYQTVGNLRLAFKHGSGDSVTDYRRDLNLENAISTVRYSVGGVGFEREAFASYPDQVIVYRLTADRAGQVGVGLSFDSPQEIVCQVVGADILMLSGVAGSTDAEAGVTRFAAPVRVLVEGAQARVAGSGGGAGLSVADADAVTLLISMASSYRSATDVSGDAVSLAMGHLEAAGAKSYDELRRVHVADYQRLYSPFGIELGDRTTASALRPTDERIARHAEDADTSLAALYCQYARYLLIACSRSGGLPATLQGVWNDTMDPPWGSKLTVNINTEMNYWPAGPANLLECYTPLFEFLESLSKSGARTAKTLYGAGGWVCHHNTDAWQGTAPVDDSRWGTWPTGGAWLCKSFWDYYEFTGDRAMLEKYYPVLRGSAEFFLDTLVEHPREGFLVTNPSVSPENPHHRDVTLCAGPTMDNAILRDLFGSVARASEILGIDDDFRQQVLQAAGRLAPHRISADGRLQEWLDDWEADAPEQEHRHVSHLYSLYPSNEITPGGTPELAAAVEKSLTVRGDESTGWATTWRINLWARLLDGDHARKLVTFLLSPERTAPNMFDLHPPFQIDGNFGGAAGIIEMLLQSHDGEIHLLPALPSAWPQGSIRGALARGGFEVSIEWEGGKLKHVTLLSRLGGECRVRFANKVVSFSTCDGESYSLDGALQRV